MKRSKDQTSEKKKVQLSGPGSAQLTKIELAFYLAIMAVIMVVFTVLDFMGLAKTDEVKFDGILMNSIMLAYIVWKQLRTDEKRNSSLPRIRQLKAPQIALGLVVTLAADLYLTYLGIESLYVLGVALFCVVQSIYALFLIKKEAKEKTVPVLMLRLGLYFLTLALLSWMKLLDLMTGLAAYSMVQLILNVIFAFSRSRREQTKAACMFAVGLLLFWCCDVCVGLSNAGSYLTGFPEAAAQAAHYATWWFYLPAQVLILLSFAAENGMLAEKTVTEQEDK